MAKIKVLNKSYVILTIINMDNKDRLEYVQKFLP